jgi:hypothetical protein
LSCLVEEAVVLKKKEDSSKLTMRVESADLPN